MMSNLTDHAERELKLAGIDKLDIYDDLIYKAVMELVNVFDKHGHSGMSAGLTLQLFDSVARFQNLEPLSNDPEEWQKHEGAGIDGSDLWQNKRNPACFSVDGGLTYKNNDEIERDDDGSYIRDEFGYVVQPLRISAEKKVSGE